MLWVYRLTLPNIVKSGWLDGVLYSGFLQHGPWGWSLLRPQTLLGLSGLDNLSHALFWCLLVSGGLYVTVSLR